MNGTLALAPAVRAAIETASARAYPREACGVLLGEIASGAHVRVTDARELENRASGVAEFALDPGAIVAADADARARGLALAGFWHSHPDTAALPSARDFDGAWEGSVCLVASVSPARSTLAAFWRRAERFEPLALVDAT